MFIYSCGTVYIDRTGRPDRNVEHFMTENSANDVEGIKLYILIMDIRFGTSKVQPIFHWSTIFFVLKIMI